MICPRCGGLGRSRHTGYDCPKCDGTGWIDWMDLLTPWAIALLVAGVTLTIGKWLWELFTN